MFAFFLLAGIWNAARSGKQWKHSAARSTCCRQCSSHQQWPAKRIMLDSSAR
jgi:hypothetical protein